MQRTLWLVVICHLILPLPPSINFVTDTGIGCDMSSDLWSPNRLHKDRTSSNCFTNWSHLCKSTELQWLGSSIVDVSASGSYKKNCISHKLFSIKVWQKYNQIRDNFTDNMYFYVSFFMVFNTTFNYISVILWQSVLLVEETGVPGENHSRIETHNVSEQHRLHRLL